MTWMCNCTVKKQMFLLLFHSPMKKCGTCLKNFNIFYCYLVIMQVQNCISRSVSVIIDYLQAGQSKDQIPVRARFSAPVHTGPEAHPASCTMGTGSFPGVRCGQGATLTPHPFLVPRSKIE